MTSNSSEKHNRRTLKVWQAVDFCVSCGANEGDGLGRGDDLELGDIYRLRPEAMCLSLSLSHIKGSFVVSTDSAVGTVGHRIDLECAVTLMDAGTRVTEIFVLAERDMQDRIRNLFLLPLLPLAARNDYTLLQVDSENLAEKLAQVACVSFTRGTQITLGTGQQRPVEALRVGDEVLTRDNGVQPLRWIGRATQRAVGARAPIRIAAGTLSNSNDLVVSPDHRLFFYQRVDSLGAGRAELMIRARHLVNGTSITVLQGGFVDYVQLLFDNHQIIYAEGIAAESMIADEATAPLLGGDVVLQPGRDVSCNTFLHELDVQKALLSRPDAIDVLRRASRA